MSDPRLSRLAQLWAASLEASLASAEEAELKSLLDDAVLAEAWMEQQLAEEGPQRPAGALPGRLRAAFQRQFKPWTYWGLRAGLPLLGLWLFLAWPKPEAPVALNAPEEAPFQKAEPAKADRPDLGPPPGLDQRQHLWVTRQQASLSLDYELPKAGKLTALILDEQGRSLYREDFPVKGQGAAVRVRWDGKTVGGGLAPLGSYKVQLRLDGKLVEERDLKLEKK